MPSARPLVTTGRRARTLRRIRARLRARRGGVAAADHRELRLGERGRIAAHVQHGGRIGDWRSRVGVVGRRSPAAGRRAEDLEPAQVGIDACLRPASRSQFDGRVVSSRRASSAGVRLSSEREIRTRIEQRRELRGGEPGRARRDAQPPPRKFTRNPSRQAKTKGPARWLALYSSESAEMRQGL